jgi:DNA-binding MurR/RpiR family transcriptional regulator
MPHHDPPRTLGELRVLLASGRIVLSPAQWRSFQSAIDAPGMTAFEASQGLAKRAGVSPQTVDRLARHLGFRNFRDFRHLFRDHIRNRLPLPSAPPALPERPGP